MTHVVSDFDAAWKEALETFFPAFLAFFFPAIHTDVDWSQPIVWLDTELQQVAPEDRTGKQRVDKLVRVTRRDGSPLLVLIHIEIQSQVDLTLPERIFCYNTRIYDRERMAVISLAILADENPLWRPSQFSYGLWGFRQTMEFPTVKLLDLPQADLEASSSLFAALTLLHRDAQATRGQLEARLVRRAERWRRIVQQGHSAATIRALFRFLDYLLRLPDELKQESQLRLRQVEMEELGMVKFISPIEESIYQEGHEEGQVAERRDLVLRLLTRKLGPLTADIEGRVAALSPDSLLALSEALLDFTRLDELTAWLAQYPAV
ncbi:MAG: DUF4351 domain-containing protein [Chloroflexaceae bacterium]|jgi:hypothetical protein|nr:DUF4351 domain-containing protein [Chloroflexaceae bacterium]